MIQIIDYCYKVYILHKNGMFFVINLKFPLAYPKGFVVLLVQ